MIDFFVDFFVTVTITSDESGSSNLMTTGSAELPFKMIISSSIEGERNAFLFKQTIPEFFSSKLGG